MPSVWHGFCLCFWHTVQGCTVSPPPKYSIIFKYFFHCLWNIFFLKTSKCCRQNRIKILTTEIGFRKHYSQLSICTEEIIRYSASNLCYFQKVLLWMDGNYWQICIPTVTGICKLAWAPLGGRTFLILFSLFWSFASA